MPRALGQALGKEINKKTKKLFAEGPGSRPSAKRPNLIKRPSGRWGSFDFPAPARPPTPPLAARRSPARARARPAHGCSRSPPSLARPPSARRVGPRAPCPPPARPPPATRARQPPAARRSFDAAASRPPEHRPQPAAQAPPRRAAGKPLFLFFRLFVTNIIPNQKIRLVIYS